MGLEEVTVNFSTNEVRYRDQASPGLEAVKAGIRQMGYQVIEEDEPAPWWTLERKLLITSIFTLPLLLEHILMSFGILHIYMEAYWLQMAICLPVFLIGFFHFGKSALGGLKTGVLKYGRAHLHRE